MKKTLIIPTLLLFTACVNNDDSDANQDTSPVEEMAVETTTVDEACYLYTENTVDTQLVRLKFHGDSVTGVMKYLPWQKDASVGTLSGIKIDTAMELEWTYWQEGMETTEPVVFVILGDKLQQKRTRHDQTGEMYVPEFAKLLYEYEKVDCSVLPDRDY
ncbi:MAG: hypothetical protein H6551_05415 [Chitinophagales bacterium]|nr:hypothetical protein [Chitinophagaceae bacterium]MCB9064568.1 hypothetical protein [Chitinophagales bacterium]